MATNAPDGLPAELLHTPVGYEERVLAPELERAIIDSESRLHAVMQANFEKLAKQIAGIEKRIESRAMEARVDALESRLREFDEASRRIVDEG